MKTLVISTHVTYNEGVFPWISQVGRKRSRSELPAEIYGETLETLKLPGDEDSQDIEIIFEEEDETDIAPPAPDVAGIRTRAQSRVLHDPASSVPVPIPVPAAPQPLQMQPQNVPAQPQEEN
eukprot:1534105-Rhodomonas_salina.1